MRELSLKNNSYNSYIIMLKCVFTLTLYLHHSIWSLKVQREHLKKSAGCDRCNFFFWICINWNQTKMLCICYTPWIDCARICININNDTNNVLIGLTLQIHIHILCMYKSHTFQLICVESLRGISARRFSVKSHYNVRRTQRARTAISSICAEDTMLLKRKGRKHAIVSI